MAFVALFSQSCKDEAVGPTLNAGAAPKITAPAAGSDIVLKEADKDMPFGDFTWSAADWGYSAGTSYKLQMAQAGTNFATPADLGTVNALKVTGKTVGDINSILIAWGLPGDVPANVELRVTAKVSDEVTPLVSAPVSLKITPYEAFIPVTQLQVPGSYQGWDPSSDATVVFDTRASKKYEGYIYFPTDNVEFKYTEGHTWDTNYGDDGANGTLDKNGANIKIPLAGVYKLNVNLNELTHAFTRTDWGLIGSATPDGWNSDQNMTYDPATGLWYITLDLVAGEIKFRANDDWAINLGDDGANKTAEYNGMNIAIAAAGNYTIKLALNVPKYTYTVTKN